VTAFQEAGINLRRICDCKSGVGDLDLGLNFADCVSGVDGGEDPVAVDTS